MDLENRNENLLSVLLAPPSGALVVSQFQDPASPVHPVPSAYSFGCSNLL